jgi:hypothetical protein
MRSLATMSELNTSNTSSTLDRLLFSAFLVGLALIAFIAGSLTNVAGVFPGPHIARAYAAFQAYYTKNTAYNDIYASDLWHAAAYAERGVTVYVPGRVQPGATLYTSGKDTAAHLIAMDGRVLHTWRQPFSTVWNTTSSIQKPQPDSHIFFRQALMYPNGDLLAVYEAVGDTPYGYGIVKLDKHSNILWRYLGRAHHDIDVGPDGRIYALTHDIVDFPADFGRLATPRHEDNLVVLSPEGEEQLKLPLTELVKRSKYQHLLYTVSAYSVDDPLHTNTVSVITEALAARFPHGRPGQILTSFRELNAIGVVDLERQELVWATRGPWIGQHDPELLPNGHILLFDNHGNYLSPEGISRVIEVDPNTLGIVWQYTGTATRPLASAIRSEQQRLPNGNTLIVESDSGRLVEVTSAGEIVWEFLNPDRAPGRDGKGELTAIMSSARRILPDAIEAEFLALPAP